MSEIFRYVIAGMIAFMADLGSLYFFTEFVGLYYLVSNLISYTIGLIIVFLINIKWVFTVRKYDNPRLEFFIFSMIALTGLLLSEFFMWLTVESYNLNYIHAKIVATAFVFIFNYLLRKILLFSR